jgi:hypothetical protein
MDLNKQKIKEIFINELGEPDSLDKLNEYLDFIISYNRPLDGYFEKHHILPNSLFKGYEKTEWNLVKLLYEDHIKAHEILAMAYINRITMRPLNFMKSNLSKNSNLLSKASKKGWKKLKSDEKKYNQWRLSRSNHMKSLSSEERGRRSKKAWDSYSNEDYIKRCEINKMIWNEDRKRLKSEQMKSYFKDNPSEMHERMSRFWKNMDPNKKEQWDLKMSKVNKDPLKRKKASESLKKKWEEEDFRKKMKNRKTTNYIITAITPDGKKIQRKGLTNLLTEFDLNYHLVKKFNNTGKPVESKNVKNRKNISNTIGWKFYYKEYGKTKKNN